MSKPPYTDIFSNRWGWQFMQADGMSVAAMNATRPKRPKSTSSGGGAPRAPPVPPAPPLPTDSRVGASTPSIFGNLISTIGQGFAFGTGSAIAHKAVDTVVGTPLVIEKETTEELIRSIGVSCRYFKAAYDDCVQHNRGECEKINDHYKECLEILKKYDNVLP